MVVRLTSYVDVFFFFQAEDGIRDLTVTGVQTCALPIFQCPLGASVDAWHDALEGVDGVFHLAWSTIPKTADRLPLDDVTTNVVGTVGLRSEERRVGKECRSRWSPYH